MRPNLVARFWPALLQFVARRAPAVRAVGIPDDIRVAQSHRALRGVPRHPAIRQAIEDDRARLVASGGLLEPLHEIGSRFRGNCAVADVGKPQAARNVVVTLFAPYGRRREVRGLWNMREHVDEGGGLFLPEAECVFRIDGACARQRSGRRRTIVLHPVISGFRRAVIGRLRADDGRDEKDDQGRGESRSMTRKAFHPFARAQARIVETRLSRRARQALVALCALVAVPCGNVATAMAGEPFVREIAPGVFAHQGQVALTEPANRGDIANAGFIVGDDAVAVIDCGGSVAVGEALLAAVRGVTAKPIRYVVMTHVHPDHIFGAAAFAPTGAAFVGHRNLPRALAARGEYYLRSFRSQLGAEVERVKIVVPSMLVEDRTTLDLGGRGIEVRAWAASHTDNDVTVFDPASGVLFTGDLVFLQHTPIVDGSLLGFLKAIDGLEKLPATRVVPGHGAVGAEWPKALADEKRYFLKLASDLRQLAKQGADIERAAREAGQSERANWALFDNYAPRNATAGLAEIEWE